MIDVKNIITEAAQRYGVDPDVALRIAHIESKLDPSAMNALGSGAAGLFQFIPSTWKAYGQGKNALDARANADAGMRFTLDNIKGLRSSLGREPTAGEIYLAHQQGLGGALKLLTNPNASATSLVGPKAVTMNGGHQGMTGADFAQLWMGKMEGVSVNSDPLVYGGVAPASMGGMEDSSFTIGDQGTIRYGDAVPALGETDQDRREEEQRQEENAYGFFEGAAAAAYNEMSIFAPFRALGDYDVDPGFKVTEESLRKYGEGVPDQYLEEFEDAVSDQHMEAIRGRLLEQMQTNQKIADMGLTGTALGMAAAMLDPGAIAAGVAIGALTGGTGLAPAVTARLGRVGLVGLTATEFAVGNLVTDAALIAVDPTRNEADLKWSVGAGLMLGGAYGAIRAKPVFTPEADALSAVGQAIQKEALNEAISPNTGSTVGARQVGSVPGLTSQAMTDAATFNQVAQGVEAVAGNIRFDVASQFLKASNPMMKVLGRHFFEDAVRASKGKVTEISASENLERMYRVSMATFAPDYMAGFKLYKKEKGIGLLGQKKAQREFGQEVSDYILQPNLNLKAQASPAIKTAGEAFTKGMNEFERQATEAGLMSARGGAKNYMPRYVDVNASSKILDDVGYEGVAEFYGAAIRKAQGAIDPELIKKMGLAFAKRFHKMRAGSNFLEPRLTSFNVDDLEDILKDYVTTAEVDMIKAQLKTADGPKEPNVSGNLKKRVILDELFEAEVVGIDGLPKKLRMSDFYIRDPWQVFTAYSRHMSGQIAMSKVQITDEVTGELLVDGIRTTDDWAKLKERVKAVSDQTGGNWKADEENLDFFYAHMTGTPYRGVDETTEYAKWVRAFRDWNFMRLMGQVGIAQIPELGRIVGTMGFKTTVEAVPAIRQVIKLAREGKSDVPLLNEMYSITGMGSEWSRSAIHVDTDDYGTPLSMGGKATLPDRIAPVSHQLSRVVGLSSGMTPINAMLQVMTGNAIALRFSKWARGMEDIPDHHLKSLGLTTKQAEAVKKEFAKATYDSKGKLVQMNLDQWSYKTREAFEQAVFRHSREIILEADVGQSAKWMNRPTAKMFTQFRTFAIHAYTKALLRGYNHRDAATLMSFLGASFLGSMTYVGQTWVNAQGDENAARKLKDRLTTSNIVLGGIQRSSESSIIPLMVDTGAIFTTGEPMFDFRTTGLASNMLFGNPTYDLIDNLKGATSGLFTAVGGDDYSKEDFGALRKVLPFQRTVGMINLLNVVSNGLDKEMVEF